MEQRAERIRFEAAIAAAASYLKGGGTLERLNVPALEQAGLFPSEWHFDPAPDGYRDTWAIPVAGKVGIGVIGSRSGVHPIIEAYGSMASVVLFPFPRRWSVETPGFFRALFEPVVASSATGEDTGLLLMVFDQRHLQELAARIAAAPALNPASIPREASRLSPSH